MNKKILYGLLVLSFMIGAKESVGSAALTLDEFGNATFGANVTIGSSQNPVTFMVNGQTIGSTSMDDDRRSINYQMPLGTVIDWWCPPSSHHTIARIPSGYWVCDGSFVSDPESPYFRMNLPDLRGAFSWGAMNTVDVGSMGWTESGFLYNPSQNGLDTRAASLSPTPSGYARAQERFPDHARQEVTPSAPILSEERYSSPYPPLFPQKGAPCVRLMKLMKIK